MFEPVILKDEIMEDGTRHVTAVPSEAVCSKQIDIVLRNDVIEKVGYLRGCQGNLLGLGALLKGMKVQDAVARLRGIDCHARGTSCPDQFARVMEKIM